MPRFIVRLEGRYFEWSTVVDSPITAPMTREEFAAYYREEYGRSAMTEFEERMVRVEERGVSAFAYESAEDLMDGNRAGADESEMTLDQLRAWARGKGEA